MSTPARRPRLGFLGVGWIGLHRMKAVLDSGIADVVAIADSSPELLQQASHGLPQLRRCASLDELLRCELDGVAIATPSALHARQALQCLDAGLAVFCQKPLARDLRETETIVSRAREADRLLGVDFSYRHTAALRAIKGVLESGELGPIYNARFVFHNAYGPDKPWYYTRESSGGGCLIDLGIHLVDSALWLLDAPRIVRVDSALYQRGERLRDASDSVEDFASARLETERGACIDLACSWKLPAGVDAEIQAELYGPHGGVRFRNVGGSFYDFVAERMHGTSVRRLAEPPDAWGGRAIVAWAERLTSSPRFHEDASSYVSTAALLDRIYMRTSNS